VRTRNVINPHLPQGEVQEIPLNAALEPLEMLVE